jgi:hypothetical protein
MRQLKRITLLSLMYIALLSAVTLLAALVKGQTFHFSIGLNLIIPVICAFITELLPGASLGRPVRK